MELILAIFGITALVCGGLDSIVDLWTKTELERLDRSQSVLRPPPVLPPDSPLLQPLSPAEHLATSPKEPTPAPPEVRQDWSAEDWAKHLASLPEPEPPPGWSVPPRPDPWQRYGTL